MLLVIHSSSDTNTAYVESLLLAVFGSVVKILSANLVYDVQFLAVFALAFKNNFYEGVVTRRGKKLWS